MTRYLLDTNTISNVVKPQPLESLLSWMSVQPDNDLFIASLTVGEIRRGIPDGDGAAPRGAAALLRLYTLSMEARPQIN